MDELNSKLDSGYEGGSQIVVISRRLHTWLCQPLKLRSESFANGSQALSSYHDICRCPLLVSFVDVTMICEYQVLTSELAHNYILTWTYYSVVFMHL